jgi:hypothetical protein
MGVEQLATSLITSAELKAYLGASVPSGADDAFLDQLVITASQWCRTYCRRDSFLSRSYVHDGSNVAKRRLDGTGTSDLYLKNTPVTALTGLKRRFDEDELIEGPDFDYTFDPWTGRISLTFGVRFPDEAAVVELTYQGGFLPETEVDADMKAEFGFIEKAGDLKVSVLKAAAVLFHKRRREKDGIVSFSSETGTFTLDPSALPKEARETWDLYRHRAVPSWV